MKKNYWYLFPLLIILCMFLSFSLSMIEHKTSKSASEIIKPEMEAKAHNRKAPANEKINDPEIALVDNWAISSRKTAILPAKPGQGPSIPILMYHEIGDGPSSLYVSENNFRAQMHYLLLHEYKIVTMEQAREMLANKQIPPKTAVITFDDGYVSVYTRAWPILQECGFTATIYICSSFPGLYNYLTWDQIKILHSGGIEVGSHTENHIDLNTLNETILNREISGSKQVLESKLGSPIKSFCYPIGSFNKNTPNWVKNAGYTSAVTVAYGKATPNNNMYLIPRIRVFKVYTLTDFAKSLQ